MEDNLLDNNNMSYLSDSEEEFEKALDLAIVGCKKISEEKKKAIKNKELFTKTKAQIESNITGIEQKQTILDGLKDIIDSTSELESQLLSVNTSQNKILADKNSGKIELLEIFEEDNNLRKPVLKSLVSFHELVRENSSDAEFEKIIKSFLKEAQMSSK